MRLAVAAFYHFARIEVPIEKRGALLALCRSERVRGTLVLAQEGVNGTIAGEPECVAAVVDHVRSWPEFGELEVRYSFSTSQPFDRIKVKIKGEIVTMGRGDVDPGAGAGQYVEPADWNDLITREDVLLVDTRNEFEIEVGRFPNAVSPGTGNFREFPNWADRLTTTPDEPSAVAMYCTGGIRCEKATAYMRKIGFDQVFHLKGGILKYLEEVPEGESLWEGECFVFDDRVSVKHGLNEGDFVLCYGCQRPVSQSECESPLFEEGVSCSKCHDSLSERDRARYRERQRQITLALSRGEQHLRDDANSAASTIA